MTDSPSISDTELEVLKALWEDGPGSVRDVHARLEGRAWAYTTVQTLLQRLCDKSYVKTRRLGRAYEFSAAVSRDELISQQIDGLADRMYDGATTPLLLSVFQGKRFSKKEVQRFRELLDELEKPRKKSRKKES